MIARTNVADPGEMAKLKSWWDEFNLELVRMGCVQYLMGDVLPAENYQVLGSLYELLRKIKNALDPNNIMNPSRIYGGV
jgi:FAD/FMN-containing dehydrogenase